MFIFTGSCDSAALYSVRLRVDPQIQFLARYLVRKVPTDVRLAAEPRFALRMAMRLMGEGPAAEPRRLWPQTSRSELGNNNLTGP